MNFGEKYFSKNIEKTQEKSDKDAKKEIVFPHAESILRLFRDKYKDDPEKAEIMEDVLYEFFRQEMENTEIFESKKLGAAFPWTVIRTKDLARKIIARYSNSTDALEKNLRLMGNGNVFKKQEFIFSSGSMMKSGYQFTFVEEAMHQAIIALKSELTSIKEGNEAAGKEIYTLGLPTNELGKISPEFLEKLKQDPFRTMGELMSEFVESRIPKDGNGQFENIRLYGVSTGASFAAATGERLMKDKIVTQDNGDGTSGVPHLSIRMNSPVGLSKSTRKNWQIPLGYAAEFIYQTAIDPKFRLSDPKFMSQVKKALDLRGIKENMTDKDKKMKKEAIDFIVKKLIKGVDFSHDVKVTKVTGVLDPLTFSPKEYRDEKNRRIELSSGLGRNMAPRTEKNRREFMINMTHTPAFFRDSELKRYYKTASLVQELKSK